MNFLHRVVLSAALAAPAGLFAQSADLGPLILRIPSSTRALAMGNVAVAGRDDDVLFYNPAQLVAARGMSVSAEQFSSTAYAAALSSVTRFSTGGIAVGATMAEFDSRLASYPVTREDLVLGGPVLGSAGTLVVGIAQVFKSVRIGGAAKFVEERVGPTRNARGVFDLGLGRDFFGYAFGLAVQNIGQSFKPTTPPGSEFIRLRSEMPLRTTLGAARGWNTNVFDFNATVAVSVLRDGFVVPAGGGEMSYSWLDGYTVILRAGGRRPERGENPFTAGLGFTVDRLSIDYALETLSGSRVANRIGLRIR
jgi:hypothetical protein